MIGEAFICDAGRTPIGRYAGAWLVLTVARELELRRAKHALRTMRIGLGQGISAAIEHV